MKTESGGKQPNLRFGYSFPGRCQKVLNSDIRSGQHQSSKDKNQDESKWNDGQTIGRMARKRQMFSQTDENRDPNDEQRNGKLPLNNSQRTEPQIQTVQFETGQIWSES